MIGRWSRLLVCYAVINSRRLHFKYFFVFSNLNVMIIKLLFTLTWHTMLFLICWKYNFKKSFYWSPKKSSHFGLCLNIASFNFRKKNRYMRGKFIFLVFLDGYGRWSWLFGIQSTRTGPMLSARTHYCDSKLDPE